MYKMKEVLPILTENYRSEQIRFVFKSILDGNTPSEVYVDNLQEPSVSLIWDKGHCFYFGSTIQDFNKYEEAVKFLRDQILVEKKEQLRVVKIYFPTEVWEKALLELLVDFKPMVFDRVLYRHDLITIPKITNDDFTVKEISAGLVESNLENTHLMIEEISNMWGSKEKFLRSGFGYCAIHDNKIVCWCTSEYVSKNYCGIGIETIEEFQGKGIATATVSKFLLKCSEVKILPYWDSWKNNGPSVKVAENSGFNKELDYQIVFIDLTRK